MNLLGIIIIAVSLLVLAFLAFAPFILAGRIAERERGGK